MIISIASGKGGTGKTFLATSLARVLAASPAGDFSKRAVQLLDCDVEEPNAHLFLKIKMDTAEDVAISIPAVDEKTCIHCGECSKICAYHAITDIVKTVLVFPRMCHACGACALVCPVGAITETDHIVGTIEKGKSGNLIFMSGKMKIKEVAAPHIIRKVKEGIDPSVHAIIDAPPGTTCPAVTAVSGSDYCVLVTEPTPFGLNDLKLAAEMVRRMNIPSGVVINRDGIGDDAVENYCREEGIPLLLKIPHKREIAEIYARGGMAADELPLIRQMVEDLALKLFINGKEAKTWPKR